MVSPAVRMEVIWDSDATLWAMNVLHLRFAAAAFPDQATADALAAEVSSAFTTAVPPEPSGLNAVISNTVRLHSIRLRDLRAIDPPTWQANILAAGTDSTDQLPDTVSLPVELTTGVGARSGRVFQWGGAESVNAPSGRPQSVYIDRVVGFWDLIRQNVPSVPGVEALAVLSRVSNTTSDVVGVRRTPTMVAAGWSTQRRRRDGLQLIV